MSARHVRGALLAVWTVLTPAQAQARPPSALASQTSDGMLTLVLRPERSWSSAELTVAGTTFDLPEAKEGEGVEIETLAVVRGSHRVVLRVAEEDGRGVTFRFVVDTQVLPDRPPRFEHGAPREWMWRPFQRPAEAGEAPATRPETRREEQAEPR